MSKNSWDDDSGGLAVLEVISRSRTTPAREVPHVVAKPTNVVQVPVTLLISIASGLAVILISFGSWLAIGMQDLKMGQADVRARLEYTSNRVDRIGNEVPSLRRVIAREHAKAPVRQAIVTTPPQRRDSATSVAAINVIDIGARKRTAYYFTLSNQQAIVFESAIRGVVTKSAPNAISLGDMVGLADTSTNASVGSRWVPVYVDANSSYMVFASTDSVPIQAIYGMFGRDSMKSFRVVITGVTSWKGVMSEVAEHPANYSIGVGRDTTRRRAIP